MTQTRLALLPIAVLHAPLLLLILLPPIAVLPLAFPLTHLAKQTNLFEDYLSPHLTLFHHHQAVHFLAAAIPHQLLHRLAIMYLALRLLLYSVFQSLCLPWGLITNPAKACTPHQHCKHSQCCCYLALCCLSLQTTCFQHLG